MAVTMFHAYKKHTTDLRIRRWKQYLRERRVKIRKRVDRDTTEIEAIDSFLLALRHRGDKENEPWLGRTPETASHSMNYFRR